MTVDDFAADKQKVAAVGFHGIIIGEAAGRALGSGYRIEDPELVAALEDARAARNEFVHEYDVIEPDNIFATLEHVYLPLQDLIRRYLGLPIEPPAPPDGSDPDDQPGHKP